MDVAGEMSSGELGKTPNCVTFVSVLPGRLAQAFREAPWNAASLRTASARSVSETIA